MMQVTAQRLRNAGFCVGVGLVLAGCVVGPHYQAPKVELHEWHTLPTKPNSAQVSAPMAQWWSGFEDPVLDAIVAQVLRQNLEVQGALARVDAARAVAREHRAALLPSGEFDASAGSERQSLNGPLGTIAHNFPGYRRDQTLRDVGAGASWELDLFGQLRQGARAAAAEAQASEAEQTGVRIVSIADAADAYFAIRSAQLRQQVALTQIDTDQQLLRLVQLRLAQGVATERELAQAKALLASARATLPPLRLQLQQQMNRLDVLMGEQPGEGARTLLPMEGFQSADFHVRLPSVSAESPEEFLRRRPDIMAAERRLAAANARVGVVSAEYYPKISLSGLLGFESLQGGFLFTSQSFQPQVAAGLRWRIFDFGRVDAEIAAANASQREVLMKYRLTVLKAAEDVEDAFAALLELQAESNELNEEVKALSDAREAAQAAYLGGAVDLIDVLDADRQLLTAKDALTRTEVDVARAAVSAFRALGGGW